MRVWHKLALMSALMVGLLAAQPARAQSPDWWLLVTKTEDTNDGLCSPTDCSLREAIITANTNPTGSITIPPGIYTLSIAGADENAAATGDLDILAGIGIVGAGADQTIIDAGGIDRAFHVLVLGGSALEMDGVTVRNGNVTQPGIDGRGGGILNEGSSMVLTNVVVTGNRTSNATGDGAGIATVNGFTTIIQSIVSGNDSIQNAGGILNLNSELTIDNSTISGNTAGLSSIYEGGGLWNTGVSATTIINRSTFSDNSALNGGAISSDGNSLTVSRSIITGSTATLGGGAIHNQGVLIVNYSTLSGNSADAGGAIFNSGTATIDTSIIAGNEAGGDGGGIANSNSSSLTVRNTTIVNNSAVLEGGGIDNLGTATLIHTTISGNSATTGRGIAHGAATGSLTIRNSVVASSLLGGNCFALFPANIISAGYNLSNDASCAASFTATGDQNNTDPLLGTLGNYGGPTQTIPPQPGSPAINAIPPISCGVTGDQRGVSRPKGAGCEIGAYEGGLPQTYAVTKVADTNDGVCDSDCSLREAINAANLNPTSTVSIPAGTYTLSITGAGENGGATGDLDINTDMTITGADAATTTIDGLDLAPDPDRVLHITGAYTVNISGVTISHGNAARPYPDNRGGGIFNPIGHLTLSHSIVTQNQVSAASGEGGGIAAMKGSTTLIQNSTLSNNSSTSAGGAIFNFGALTIHNSTINGNSVAPNEFHYGGGGLYSSWNTASNIITDSTFRDNVALRGGAVTASSRLFITNTEFINNHETAVAGSGTITDSTFVGNSNGNDDPEAGVGGGAIRAGGFLIVTNSTFIDNEAMVTGGAIYAPASAIITNSTFTSNIAPIGAAVQFGSDDDYPEMSTLNTMTHNTLQENAATTGGIFVADNAVVSLTANIFDSNPGGNCALSASPGGVIQSNGYNLSSDASCAAFFTATGDQNSVNPLLGPLGNFGGLTQTIPLYTGSPAIDVIPSGNCAVAADQRGVARPVGAGCDSGAYEGEVPSGEAPERNYFTTDTPTLTWVGQANAAGYEVQVATDASFANVVYSSIVLPATAREVTTDSLADGKYYWRVRAVNGAGIGGNWSQSDTFVVDAE